VPVNGECRRVDQWIGGSVDQQNIVANKWWKGMIIISGKAYYQDNIYLINGLILDEETRAPLAGVTIQDSVTGMGKVSNEFGKFAIEIKEFPAIFVFRHLGYFEDTLRIKNRNQYKEYIEGKTVIITLRLNPFLIDEVVVSNSRLATKLFEKETYALIDFVIKENSREIHCFKTNGEIRWTTNINTDLSKDFTGLAHYDKISNRYFLEFVIAQLSYLIEIDPVNGDQILTIPILKFKHIDHISISGHAFMSLHDLCEGEFSAIYFPLPGLDSIYK